jgi:hypothetical protein
VEDNGTARTGNLLEARSNNAAVFSVDAGGGVTTTARGAFGSLRVTSPSVPATATSAGTAGDIAWDSSYIYICTASNTWKRVAIATW